MPNGSDQITAHPLQELQMTKTIYDPEIKAWLALVTKKKKGGGNKKKGRYTSNPKFLKNNLYFKVEWGFSGESSGGDGHAVGGRRDWVPVGMEIMKKYKKKRAKKSSKPPRPPRGPSLDAADQKLIREINDLALLKHARVERVRELKKTKAAKASSSNNSLFALLSTIFFFLVLLFQGMSSGSLLIGNHGSLEPATRAEGDLISVNFQTRLSPLNIDWPDFESPRNLVESSNHGDCDH